MPLAKVADVKRVGRIATDSHDSALEEALAVAELLVKRYLKYDPEAGDDQTLKLYDVRSDGFIPLPSPEATVTEVRVGDVEVGATNGYDVEQTGIRLRLGGEYAVRPEERTPDTTRYRRVEVDFDLPGDVNVAIRDGTAFAALAIWRSGPQSGSSSVSSERIGDYSYNERSSDADVQQMLPDNAKALLRPFRRRPVLVP